ncbi:MAG: hypothetical protein HY646_08245 [Acidobacteria bacterium]|nr:hypothetical protein [Acidobacteriota bacterium]
MLRCLLLLILVGTQSLIPASRRTLFIAPLYIEYTSVSDETFAREAQELKGRLGNSPAVKIGFTAFLPARFPDVEATLKEADLIVQRAEANGLPVHIAVVTGFFHGHNNLRENAIREDVRNAQWFADGTIAPPKDLVSADRVPGSAWITPSRYAQHLRTEIEDSVRKVGAHLVKTMQRAPNTLVSVSGDGEVELSFERSSEGLQADYSPFAIAEFRDWVQSSRYDGDRTPASDENRDGHTFNKDFDQQFHTWELRYFNNSGPIPYSEYVSLKEKLPRSGAHFIEGGFDAPRSPRAGKQYWETWQRFRVRMVGNYVRDFAEWLTIGGRIPESRFFSHQIPADFLFGNRDHARLHTSASPLQTALIEPLGSIGVTAYNTFNGRRHFKTASKDLFDAIARSGKDWGVLEYNPSVPATTDEEYYLRELRTLNKYRPRIIVPFAWATPPEHTSVEVKGTAFESALRKFIQEVGRE